MIHWIYQPEGKCPVQAEGFFMGKYFYFRSRHESATIEFNENITFHKKGIFIKYYVVGTTKKPYMAGWFPHWYCRLLIYKGCIMYLLRIKSNA